MKNLRRVIALVCAGVAVALTVPPAAQEPPRAKAGREILVPSKAALDVSRTSGDLLKAQWAAWAARQKLVTLAPRGVVAEVADVRPADERFRPAPEQRGLALASAAPWYRPVEVASVAGVLSVTLRVDYATLTLGADPVRLRCYNGVLAGPTLRAKAGDVLKIKLVNALPPNPTSGGHENNTLHEYNTTNLHTHGLHVSPSGNSDNVLLDVLPGATQDYEIRIPVNHPAGTFWYHAHRHGSVAPQVASGMSGAIVIEGGLDAVPEIAATKGDRDRVMLLQQIPYVIPPGETAGVVEEGFGQFGPGTWNASGRFTSINGVVLPVIAMKPGEVERWRFVDSGFRERIDLRLVRESGGGPAALDFHEIAADGIPLGKRKTASGIELWPGYRSDALVQAPPVEGVYLLVDEAVPPSATMTGDGKNRKHLAKVVVSGTPNPMGLPASAGLAAFRPPSIPAAAVTGTQSATYGIEPVGGSVEFRIDGKPYDPTAAPRLLTLGSVDEWTIRSVNGVGPVTHPFHIHVNAFEIFSIKVGGVEQLTEPIWRDTVAMKPDQTIRFRTRYEDFTGDFVQHCHILDHEDQGMMQKVRIASPVGPPTAPNPAAVPPHPLAEFRGRPAVVVLTEGLDCPACASQLKQLTAELKGTTVVGVTPKTDTDAAKAGLSGVRVIADPQHRLFRELKAFDNGPRHGVAVLDAQGKVVFQASGDKPFTDVAALRLAVAGASRDVTPVTCGCAPAPTVARVRKNIDCLTPQELAAYKHAIQVVKARSSANPNDPTGYDWQVRVHGDRLVGPCKHNSELIWPWHRAMLFYFEQTLRAADPDHPTLSTRDVTIPYWDWTKSPSGTGGYPAAFEDTASPLFHAGRNSYTAARPPTLFTDSDIGLGQPDWGLFGGTTTAPGQLEDITHNLGHGAYVGGDMASTATSPKDPIFWSHHANLDRLWDMWQQKHGTNPAQQTAALRGWAASVSPAAVVSNFNDIRKQLEYDYCNPPQPRVLDLPLPVRPDGPLSVEARVRDPRTDQSVRGSIAQVRLTGVSVPKDFTYAVRVYLHPSEVPFKPDDPAFAARYFAGRFAVWANDLPDHEGLKTRDVNLDVSRTFEAVSERDAAPKLKVSFDFARFDKGKESRVPWGTPGIEFGRAELVTAPAPFHTRK